MLTNFPLFHHARQMNCWITHNAFKFEKIVELSICLLKEWYNLKSKIKINHTVF